MLHTLANELLHRLVQRVPRGVILALHDAVAELSQAVQALEGAQPGSRQLAALAACLPCPLAALSLTTAAAGKGQKSVYDCTSTCREHELLLRAHRGASRPW